MIVDTSAIVAIFFQEATAPGVLRALNDARWIGVGTPTLAETGIVIGRRLGYRRVPAVHRFVQEFEIETVPFEALHWAETVAAYERFGRGRHRAELNFGDCLAYAVAKLANQPLLCVGEDFAHTDLELVPIR